MRRNDLVITCDECGSSLTVTDYEPSCRHDELVGWSHWPEIPGKTHSGDVCPACTETVWARRDALIVQRLQRDAYREAARLGVPYES
jgi:hypothetical protein